jgi:hypothetical protein
VGEQVREVNCSSDRDLAPRVGGFVVMVPYGVHDIERQTPDAQQVCADLGVGDSERRSFGVHQRGFARFPRFDGGSVRRGSARHENEPADVV